ncbi:MAG: MazG family protein [Clostridia bacterium]|nr:MazG family protein [Clostridia bacterium]
MITVLSLGPGPYEMLTEETTRCLQTGPLFLRTAKHPVAGKLHDARIPFQSFDSYYDQYEDFDELHHAIAASLLEDAKKHDLVYAVPDPDTDRSVFLIRTQCTVPVRILPGVSLPAYYLSCLPQPFAPSASLLSSPASDFTLPDSDRDLLITELHSRQLAGDIKILLSDLYDETSDVVFFSADQSPQVVPLYSIDRQKTYDHTCAIFVPYVPFEKKTRFSFSDLMHIMSILRSQDGCPWDQEQTHHSLRPYLIEEAYEAAGAIDENDSDHLCDELGDVLLQVAFHASIAESCTEFTRTDIATAICKKLMRRHPKIFGHTTELDADETWEMIKKQERGFSSVADSLADVSPALPALTRSVKLQKRACKAVVDFADMPDALHLAADLLSEIRQFIQDGKDPDAAIAKLFYTCTAISRLAGKDPEDTLSKANNQFIQMFSHAEEERKKARKTQNPLTLREMIVYLRSAR